MYIIENEKFQKSVFTLISMRHSAEHAWKEKQKFSLA